MKVANNKKRKIDAETSIPTLLSLTNQIPHYSLPGHNQNNFHASYSPKYGDSISPASSGISQCNQTNESGKAYHLRIHAILYVAYGHSIFLHRPL